MSHPNSLHVSPDSVAATALSHPEQQAPAATSTETAGSQPAGLVSQAQQWLRSRSIPTTLPAVPEPLKRLAAQTSSRWHQLSTTQKVVGGALLAATGWYVLRPSSSARREARNPVSTLHELLLFVNDRVEGYQRAARESPDADLRNYHEQLASQSQLFARRLNGYLRVQDSAPETGTTLKGKLYRAWMEAKAAITGYSETAVLASNVYGEEWALKAYEEALRDRTVTGSLRREVERQHAQSQQTYHKLQQLQAQY